MKWCNKYNCWCSDVEDIIDDPDCELECDDECDFLERINDKRDLWIV